MDERLGWMLSKAGVLLGRGIACERVCGREGRMVKSFIMFIGTAFPTASLLFG